MLVLSLSESVLLFVILLLTVNIIDNGNCNRDDTAQIYTNHYLPQFRAPHSPSYEHIHIPGRIVLYENLIAVVFFL